MTAHRLQKIYLAIPQSNHTGEHNMISSGAIGMPLHFGAVPTFLTERMGRVGDAVVESIVHNYGK